MLLLLLNNLINKFLILKFFFKGVYLPFLWENSFCWKSPLALGYTRGHFSALVPMEPESLDNIGAGTIFLYFFLWYSIQSETSIIIIENLFLFSKWRLIFLCSGAILDTGDHQVVFLPLMTQDGKLLPVHFLTQAQVGYDGYCIWFFRLFKMVIFNLWNNFTVIIYF